MTRERKTLQARYLALPNVPQHLEDLGVRRVSAATVYRWVDKGVSGIRLRHIRFGGQKYTTQEWLNDFSRELSE